MKYQFKDIIKENVDDLMSMCGNMPGLDKNPDFIRGRNARRQWLLEMIGKYGTVGVLAYDENGKVAGFVETIPAIAHPLRSYAGDLASTMVIDCAWYKHDHGLPVRKAILDHMLATKWFDKPLKGECRFIDVLTLKGVPLMQYDFYHDYGFKDAITITGHSMTRFLVRYPVKGDNVIPKTIEANYYDGGKNVLVLGTYRQCYMPFIVAAKVQKAVEGVEGLSVVLIDYWETGVPTVCEATMNGKPVFDDPVFLIPEEKIKDAIKAKMI